ncbi:phospholipase effector Tle1 domain-containing protein [Chryseobacterium geocarposphaerae]|uniref:Putative alpha/beta hydrolase family protein DUF2235 n=1 Tax=Chryseobacterium geocarposphaerae TaxID=1416776 RepID=A0A2M9BY02_9FLAO|nr:DUF2235 domain-containing protein [Chryseobacterium geocarposphaerae]PJJ62955.1 putative alpha/beta hydrolase family protein DUF2235 [Chryseobacterium geocarposphaerae]
MSIEYFVEGKVITQTGGDYKTFAREGIVHNSAISVQQKGKESGVSYNEAQKINPNDKPVNTIDVSLNLFFDGTLNNKTNTEAGLSGKKKSGSYANDYSNVARGYDAIDPDTENQVAWYIEGIGTVDGKSDNDTLGLPIRGAGMGIDERGIKAKVTKGCIKGAEAVKNKFKTTPINILRVNVYGFSRGAAAARHFVHVATNPPDTTKMFGGGLNVFPPDFFELSELEKEQNIEQRFIIEKDKADSHLLKYGYFGACILKYGLSVNQIQFNFVGLYDTVASYGANHRGNWFVANDSVQLGLNAVQHGAFIFQIASDNEFRENFSLTNIKDSGIKGLQITLPGVHSDIGGGYVNGEEENVLIYEQYNSAENCERYRTILIDEGWFYPDEIKIKKIVKPGRHDVTYKYELWGTRSLSNHYDKIPLSYMFEYSKQFDVKYSERRIIENNIKDNNVLAIASQLFNYIKACNDLRNEYVKKSNEGVNISASEYINKSENYNYMSFNVNETDLKTIRNKYLHWSANLDTFGMGPRISGVKKVSERKRTILDG